MDLTKIKPLHEKPKFLLNIDRSRPNDLVGQRFGRLTVLSYDSTRNGRLYWLCQCDCGNTKVVQGSNLKSQQVQSCGCMRIERIHDKLFKDLTGKKFGKLTVIHSTEIRKNESTVWLCQCDCGNTTLRTSQELNSGKVKSCGCLHAEVMTNKMLKNSPNPHMGERFGKLVVLRRYGKDEKGLWFTLCQCDCGNTIVARSNNLFAGLIKSCGCLRNGRGIKRTAVVKEVKL